MAARPTYQFSMRNGFTRNIDNRGRVVRGVLAIVLFVAACLVVEQQRTIGVLLFLSGGFVLFEAVQGWCGLRACGIKTKL